MSDLLGLMAILVGVAAIYILIGLGIASFSQRGYEQEEDEPMPRERFWKITFCWGPMFLAELDLYS